VRKIEIRIAPTGKSSPQVRLRKNYSFLNLYITLFGVDQLLLIAKCRYVCRTFILIIIDIYGDIIRVSRSFDGCQILKCIAETCNLAFRIEKGDIIGFLGPGSAYFISISTFQLLKIRLYAPIYVIEALIWVNENCVNVFHRMVI
jgi:hypothetical protein